MKNRLNGFSGKGDTMNSPLIRIWIHTFFSTKDMMPLINDSYKNRLYKRISDKLKNEYKSFVKKIDGTENHIHLLLMLNPIFSLSDVLKNIKGESSHWVNQNRFIEAKFAWQKSYEAFSVSESQLETVSSFISNQKQYHKNITFSEERALFFKKFSKNK